MTRLAIRMLTGNKPRFIVTITVLAGLFFLSISQLGMLVGWCNTIGAIINHANVDIWVMAKHTTAFEYGTPIPESRLWQVRNVAGVGWAESMFVGWNDWKAPDGRRTNVSIIGLDESCVGGPWTMAAGKIKNIHRADGVIVDRLFANQLGVNGIGDTFDIAGKRIAVTALSDGVRTFTTAPFVFTTIENARRLDGRYRPDEITYVLVRKQPGAPISRLCEEITRSVPDVEALTTRQFASRCIRYWMLNTGIGITIVLTAALGWIVCALIMSQTLYALCQDHRDHFATLLAVGFEPRRLLRIVSTQACVLGGSGMAVGVVSFLVARKLSATTSLPLEMNFVGCALLAGVAICMCTLASWMGARCIQRVDPYSVFRG